LAGSGERGDEPSGYGATEIVVKEFSFFLEGNNAYALQRQVSAVGKASGIFSENHAKPINTLRWQDADCQRMLYI
jgi:hypothetical protein